MSDQPKTKKETKASPKKDAVDKSKPADKPIAKKTNDASSNKGSSAIAWFALLLVFCLAGGGYHFYNQLQLQLAEISTGVTATQQTASNDQQQKLTYIKSEISNISNKIEHVEETASNGISLLQRQVGKSKNQWLIAEAEYLVSIANTRIQLAGDVKTAITAFQAADQRLKENGDPATFPIRTQIAKEIIALQGTEQPDIVGLSSQLLALENAVSQMKISEPHAGSAQAPEIGKGEPALLPNNIKETLDNAWNNFSKLVVVRRNDEPKAALMTPEQVELIRKNLSLKLEAARLALINGDEALYKNSLAIVNEWLSDYFDAENQAVKAAADQIQTLISTPIKATLPNVSESLSMLRNVPLLDVEGSRSEEPSSEESSPEESSSIPEDDTPATPSTPKEQEPEESTPTEPETTPSDDQV